MKLLTILGLMLFLIFNSPAYAQKKARQKKNTKKTVASTLKPEQNSDNLIGLKGQKAPPFLVDSIAGDKVSLESVKGKITVINLWAIFCAPCIAEMPDLNKLVLEFEGKDVVFLAASPHSKSDSEVFLKSQKFDYKILVDSFSIIKDYAPKDNPPKTDDSFNMILPAHIVIDKNGMVVFHEWGYTKENIKMLREAILKALE